MKKTPPGDDSTTMVVALGPSANDPTSLVFFDLFEENTMDPNNCSFQRSVYSFSEGLKLTTLDGTKHSASLGQTSKCQN